MSRSLGLNRKYLDCIGLSTKNGLFVRVKQKKILRLLRLRRKDSQVVRVKKNKV